MSDPKPLPLLAPLGNRYESLTVDSRLINGFVEKGEDEGTAYVYKRPGFIQDSSVSVGAGLGVFNWKNHVYSVFGSQVFKDGVLIIGSAVDTTAIYRFTSTLGANPSLFLNNGVKSYAITVAGAISEIDGLPNYPVSTVPGCVYLDGTTYVFDKVSSLHGSGLNDLTTWAADNLIVAQIEPDDSIALLKQLTYILALKQFYTEVFYDAGNAVGSPLGPVAGAKMNYGCVSPYTVCDVGGDAIWISRTREGSVSVVMVSSLKLQVISTPQVERALQGADFAGPVYSWAAKVDGHRFYGVTMVNTNLTLVYDLTSRFWQRWTDPNGNYLPYSSSTISLQNNVTFQHATNGNLYHLDIMTYQDAGVVFPVDIYTPNFDGGTRRIKTLSRLDVTSDQFSGLILTLQYSDDDYQTWSSPVSVDLSTDNPFWSDLGSFRKRAFRFTHSSNGPLRLKMIEAYLAVGSL